MNFAELYRAAHRNPNAAAAFALIALTGIDTINSAEIDVNIQDAYIRLKDKSANYPLSQQAKNLLTDLPPLSSLDLSDGLKRLNLSIFEAQNKLAEALWASSDDGRIVQEMIGLGIGSFPTIPLEFTYPFSVIGQLSPENKEDWLKGQESLQAAVDYLLHEEKQARSLLHKLLDGKVVFLLISTGVSGLNLIHNLLMGRLLSPAAYGQITFLNTLLLIIGLIPNAMQTVAARYGAVYKTKQNEQALNQLWRFGVKRAWIIGIIIAISVILASPLFVQYFQLRDIWLLLPIVIAIPFFVASGTERGILQGKEHYYWLSAAYLGEGIVRLGLGVLMTLLLMNANRGLDAAVWTLAQSWVMIWFVGFVALRIIPTSKTNQAKILAAEDNSEWTKLFGFTAIALLGQALITNSDFVLVKTYFDSFDAGLYAAISVIGRIVYFGTMPLTVVMIPLIARQQAMGKSTSKLFWLLMGSGAVLCLGLIGASALFADTIVSLMYGADYLQAAYLLPLYTITAALFVMTNLLVTYRVALGKSSETWMPFVAGIAQIIGVVLFHQSLETVIMVQIVIMTILFGGVAWQARR
jgi:O-antigen/teichoic acid export membrane protein